MGRVKDFVTEGGYYDFLCCLNGICIDYLFKHPCRLFSFLAEVQGFGGAYIERGALSSEDRRAFFAGQGKEIPQEPLEVSAGV